MNKVILFLSYCLLTSLTLFAQRAKGQLTLVSKKNEPFYLIFNGVQLNHQPTSIIKIENITEHTAHVKVIFENKRLPQLEHRQLNISDANGRMQDITYTIEQNKRGHEAFLVYQILPMEPIDFRNLSIQSYNYNNKRPILKQPDRNQQPIQHGPRETHIPGHNNRPLAMKDADYQSFRNTLAKTAFDDQKIVLIKNLIKHNHLTTNQSIDIIKELSFENNKLIAAKLVYEKCVDPENFYKVSEELKFDKNKTELINFINAK